MSKKNDDAARAAVQNGATTAREVAAQTNLTEQQARQALVHLETNGEVEANGKQGSGHTENKFRPTGQ